MSEPSVQIERFGETPDGEPVEAVTLDGGDVKGDAVDNCAAPSQQAADDDGAQHRRPSPADD